MNDSFTFSELVAHHGSPLYSFDVPAEYIERWKPAPRKIAVFAEEKMFGGTLVATCYEENPTESAKWVCNSGELACRITISILLGHIEEQKLLAKSLF